MSVNIMNATAKNQDTSIHNFCLNSGLLYLFKPDNMDFFPSKMVLVILVKKKCCFDTEVFYKIWGFPLGQ